MDMLQTIFSFILALGVLVTIHEFGHYWVARKLGVRILRFSVGFGRVLWSRRIGVDQTEFALAALPLGGYVKMLDEREAPVDDSELDRAFNRQPLASRFAIVLAGPAFNFLFAIVAYWLMFVVGVSGFKPVLGDIDPASAAGQAGLQAGYTIVAVNGQPTVTWSSVLHASVSTVIDADDLRLQVRRPDGTPGEFRIDVSGYDLDDIARKDFFKELGLRLERPELPVVLDKVIAGGAAEKAGLMPGDHIVSANGEPVVDWSAWVKYIQSHPEQDIPIVLRRGERLIETVLRPERIDGVGKINAAVRVPDGFGESYRTIERHGPLQALQRAVVKTWDISALTLKILGKMVLGEASVKNLSGPITIAQYAGHSFNAGITPFLAFLGLISISLGVLNLLPIPLLDGGHLLYYVVEFIRGGVPVSENVQLAGQKVGMVMLLGLMAIAFYNDLARLLG